ncbi:MAG: OmpH family outer membrane protein [Saprospiraceae bacterium]
MNFRLFTTVFLAMGALSLFISACGGANSTASTNEQTGTEAPKTVGNIVFIRLDSLTNQYTAFKEKQTALENKAAEAEKAQNDRVNAFQRDVQSFQRRANSGQMAPKDIGTEQERLAGREQAIMQDVEQKRQELQLEQLKLMSEYEENLKKVLDEVQAEFQYDYILSYGAGTGVLMANDKLDITNEVAKRINLIPMDGVFNEMEADSTAVGGK